MIGGPGFAAAVFARDIILIAAFGILILTLVVVAMVLTGLGFELVASWLSSLLSGAAS